MIRQYAQLEVVAGMKREEERQGAEALRIAQTKLAEEEERLHAVEIYVDEYHASTLTGTVDLRRLRGQHQFLSQLEQTLVAQRRQVSACRQRLEAARARWLSARMQRQAMEKLIEKRMDGAALDARRKEQRQQDELALQASARSLAAGNAH